MSSARVSHAHIHGHLLRAGSRILAALLRRGVRLGPMMLLTVPGRKTGLPRTTPVDVFEHEGRQWLVSTHGAGDSNWVRNVRAAGHGALSRGAQTVPVTVVEVPSEDVADTLRRVVGPRLARPVAGFVLRRTLQLSADASAEAFARAASKHPVFELRS